MTEQIDHQTADQGAEAAEPSPGRAAVRLHLIRRLDDAGMKRAHGVAAPAHDKLVERLVDHLAYMSPVNLDVLAECLLNAAAEAKGRDKGCWPVEVLIRSWAHGLQPVPARLAPIIATWLRSIEGPRAEAGGYLVELYRHLRRWPIPVSAAAMRMIMEQSADNNRQRGLVQDRIARGVVRPDDAQWLAAWQADEQAARALVDLGRAGRDGASLG